MFLSLIHVPYAILCNAVIVHTVWYPRAYRSWAFWIIVRLDATYRMRIETSLLLLFYKYSSGFEVFLFFFPPSESLTSCILVLVSLVIPSSLASLPSFFAPLTLI